MHDRIVRQIEAPPHRFIIRDFERQPTHLRALVGSQPVLPLRLGRTDGAVDLPAIIEQPPDQPASHEAVGAGDENLHGSPAPPALPRRSRSASTIICTNCSKLTFGVQPSSLRARLASARSTSTSASRTNLGSTFAYCCPSSPACANAAAQRSRTVCIVPLPTT